MSSFSILDRYSNPLRLVLAKDVKPHLPGIRNMYLKSLEIFYKGVGDGLSTLIKPQSDKSKLVVNRLCTINQRRLEWIMYLQQRLQENGHFDGNEKTDISTCRLEADQIISETTIKIHCSSSFYDPAATQIPTVKEILRAYTIMSAQSFEHQLTYCTSAIKKDLEGFKDVAKSCLHREESISQVKKLFLQTKETLTQARDVIFNLRRVCSDTYGPNSPQVEILDNCIAKLTFIVRKGVVHVADGPYLKNVTFLYDQILQVIGICKHILETFQPIQLLPPYLEPAFIDSISKVLTLFQAMFDKWTENGSDLKKQFKDQIIKFIKKNGFLFRLYVPSQASISVETIQAIRQVRLHLHSKESNPHFKARVENVLLHLSIPVEFEYADETAEISILPVIVAYTSAPNIKPNKSTRILNLQLIETLDVIVSSIPHCYRPNWVTQLKSDDWIPVKEITNRIRWIENYLSRTNHGIFGCCWMYNHHQGDFSENEMDVLETEAAVVISE